MFELSSIVGLIIGIAIGYIAAKVLKVAIVVALVLVVLAYLGITVVSRGQVEELFRYLVPAVQWIKAYVESSQLFALGLLLGFALGILK
jgi:uncharacterized membrane protein (Fun14 family)